jgi:hypothetical protein
MKRCIWLLALSMVACVPPYRPAVGGKDGYLEDELSPGIYRVHYQFNQAPRFPYVGPTFDELVLLRAADLTLERGQSYFILDENALPGFSWGGRSLTIRLFSEPPILEGLKVYDAREIASQIRARHSYLAD